MARNPEDTPSIPEDNPEDGTPNLEDSADGRKGRRPYHLSKEGKERLSELGKSRWAGEAEASQRAAELSERERRLQEALAASGEERLRLSIRREVDGLPEATSETILRVRGVDYRIENGKLNHLWFPPGRKARFEEGQWFRYQGRAYQVSEGRLRPVPPSAILSHLLDKEV